MALVLFSGNILFCQANQDARMLGMTGAYTTLAKGYRAVGINPANLAVYQSKSWNIIDFSLGLSNNYISIENYNSLSGAHLDDSTHENYYPREKILSEFGGKGLRIMPSLNIPVPGLNMSTRKFAFTSRFSSDIDMGLSDAMIHFLFSGNPFDTSIFKAVFDLDIEEFIVINQEVGLSFGHSFQDFSAGITIKYLLGLYHMDMEPISSTTITTDYDGSHGNPQYIIRQAIGGNGLGLDFGIASNEFNDGYRIGLSIINLLGTIKWTQNHFIRGMLTPSISQTDYYLRPNELMFVNLVIDSVSIASSGDSSIYYEMYNVIPTESIDYISLSTKDSALVVELSDGSYLLPSGGNYKLDYLLGDGIGDTNYILADNYSDYVKKGSNPYKTYQPIYLRMGISKRIKDQVILAMDLVTGFSNRFSSSTYWKLSLGTEIIRYKDKYFRMGYAFGGVVKKSYSFGYGSRLGSLYYDLGFSLNGGFTLIGAKGFDLAAGFIWQIE